MRKTGADDLAMEEAVESSSGTVIRLPSYKTIPDPSYPLGQVGRKVYDTWCKTLLDQGMLTAIAIEGIEMLAIAKQGIADTLAAGKQPSTFALNTLRTATIRLERLDVNKTLGEADGHENVYSHFGFARRERKNRFGK